MQKVTTISLNAVRPFIQKKKNKTFVWLACIIILHINYIHFLHEFNGNHRNE